MSVNDQTSPAGTSKAADTDSCPRGLVNGVLGSVLKSKETSVFVAKSDTGSAEENENIHEKNDQTAADKS